MIPEIRALNDRSGVIRIPHQFDVPVTRRIRHLIDTEPFQQLSRVSQLGLVSLVYPGATHTRFEHSLGVYRNALLFADRLLTIDAFRTVVTEANLESLVVAALLHDLGHWPYCHPIEDMSIEGVPKHEELIAQIISSSEIAELFQTEWSLEIEQVVRLIRGEPNDRVEQMLCSILSGPIDIDKMDYLYRDSLHCGVPYGMNFDSPRLIKSLRTNKAADGIAISSKGKTAAEMMVFARYVMFSEVYWHHAVRSATAMLQRVFYLWSQDQSTDLEARNFTQWDDHSFVDATEISSNKQLSGCLFGSTRRLYKRLLDYNADQNPEIFKRLAHQPYKRLMEIGQRLARAIGQNVSPHDILIDAPPPGLEVQFKVEVNDESTQDSLENISPVVKALAQKQFDHFVKRVRVFVHPRFKGTLTAKAVEQILKKMLDD